MLWKTPSRAMCSAPCEARHLTVILGLHQVTTDGEVRMAISCCHHNQHCDLNIHHCFFHGAGKCHHRGQPKTERAVWEDASYRKERAALGYNSIANLAMPIPTHLHAPEAFTLFLFLSTQCGLLHTDATALVVMQGHLRAADDVPGSRPSGRISL